MTLTRELRTSIAFTLAILTALTVFVWGNQRQAHADVPVSGTLVLCWINGMDGIHPPVPMFDVGTCDDQNGTTTPPTNLPQCADGIDNDHDGKTDWGVPGDTNRDPGCSTPTDNDESDDPTPPAACADGIDNDHDGKVDMEDPGCSSASDNDETDQGGGGSTPACSNSQDDDSDGKIDFPADPGCTSADDTDETDATSTDNGGNGTTTDNGGSNNGGGSGNSSSHHHHSSGGSSNSGGEVLGAETECPMYLTGYIRYGAQNDAAEVSKLQVFLNDFEGHALTVSGIYDKATLAAVNAFQNKYAADILEPWGAKGATGYVYYTTQKEINTIYCKFGKDFPLSSSQIQEITQVRAIQPQLRSQGVTSMHPEGSTQAAAAATGSTPAVGSVVPANTKIDENSGVVNATSAAAAAANASSTQGWFSKFIHWLFGR